MPNFLQRLFARDFGPPPPPDQSHHPTFQGQRIVEVLYSDSKRERAFITVDDSGLYRINIQWWDTSDWNEWQKAFWSGKEGDSYADTLDRARELASEALRCSRHDHQPPRF